MDTSKTFLLYRSSAGSGKTYNLAREYLSLALRYPDNFKRILAVTFTNKSTNEMKSRIVEQLARMSDGDNMSDMAKSLKKSLGFDDDKLRNQASIVLSRILHNYSYFAVSTIDSFFQRIIGAFTRESGIAGGYSIELDQDKVISDIIDQIYEDITEDRNLRNWLVRYSEAKVDENRNWDVRNELLRHGKNLLKEDYQKISEEVNKSFESDEDKIAFINELYKTRFVIENTLSSYAKEGLDIIAKYDLEIDDFLYKSSGVVGYLLKLSNKNIDKPGIRVQNALNDKDKWCVDNSPRKEEIIRALNDGLFNQLIKCVEFYNKNFRIYNTILSVLPLFHGFAILLEIDNRLSRYRIENRMILVSDLTKFLRQIIGENDTPFIYEKAGSFLNHFLIDEFQDTSTYQWENFKPLITNAIAQNNRCLVVGDVKQSIYRWRGGDWQIITSGLKVDIGQQRILTYELDTNWRSLPNIVEFNNYIFRNAPFILYQLLSENLAQSENDELINYLMDENQVILNGYRDAVQQVADKNKNRDISGEVNIRFFNDDNESGINWQDQVLEQLPGLLEDAQDKGFSLSDIAILVRNKKDGALIAQYLMDYQASQKALSDYRYDVISSESLYLMASESVQILINAIRILYNHNDKVALFNLLYFNQLLKQGNAKELQNYFPAISNKELNHPDWFEILPHEFLKQLDSLIALSLSDLLEELIRIFELNSYPLEYAYLMALQDALLEYLKNGRGDIEDFLQWWSLKGETLSVQSSEEQNSARILTIHKSKGLQFKVVIIPFCDWSLDHEKGQEVIWCTSKESVFEKASYLPVRYSSKLVNTYYEEAYYEEQRMAFMDNLNLLYVAMTRSEEILHVFGKVPKIEKDGHISIKRSGDLLYALASDTSGLYAKEKATWQENELISSWDIDLNSFRLGTRLPHKISDRLSSMDTLSGYITIPWGKRLQIRKDKDVFFDNSIENEVRSKINEGLIVHEILSRVIRKEQLDSSVKRAVLDGSISAVESKSLKDKITKMISNPLVKNWFNGDWHVKTEVPVLPQTGELYRLDRVMIQGGKAIVVDYKTGEISENDKKQVLDYVNLLKQMGYKSVEGYLLFIGKNDVFKVA